MGRRRRIGQELGVGQIVEQVEDGIVSDANFGDVATRLAAFVIAGTWPKVASRSRSTVGKICDWNRTFLKAAVAIGRQLQAVVMFGTRLHHLERCNHILLVNLEAGAAITKQRHVMTNRPRWATLIVAMAAGCRLRLAQRREQPAGS